MTAEHGTLARPARVYVGVDGGGSKTRALVGDVDGRVLGSGGSKSSNLHSVGFDAATAAVLAAVNEAVFRAGGAHVSVAAAVFGLAGLDREEDRARVDAWLVAQGLASRHRVVQDTHIVLAAAAETASPSPRALPWGIALICGTGTVCHGVARSGAHVRAGGFGYLLGDEGSGYDLAVRALRLATLTADGRADAHALLETAFSHFGCARIGDLCARVYGADLTRGQIAAFATSVLALGEAGDRDARSLTFSVAAAASALLTTVAARLGESDPPIALAGGVLAGSAFYRDAMIAHTVAAGLRCAERATIVRDPAEGALAMARLLDTAAAAD